MGRFYGYKPLDEDQINQSAQLLAQGLGTGTTTPTYTWDDYEDWWLNALNDGKVTRAEWKDLGTKLGISGKAARKAFNQGGSNWGTYLSDTIKPKLTRNTYIYRDPTTGVVEVISQGDAKYSPTDYEAAYYKGTDPSKLVDAYNTALADARKNATITYKQGPDGKWGYYTSYRVGNYDINDLNVTDSDWFQNDTDRRTNAQLKAYKQAVDSYNKNEFKDYLNDDGTALLSKLTLDGGDAEKKAKLKKEAWDKLSDEDKKTLQKDVTSAIVKLYSDTANAGGSITWDNAVKAAARHKALMDYYNSKSIPWLDKLTWQDGSNYNKASNIKAVSSDDRTGNLIFRKGGFIRPRTLAKGGMIVKAGLGEKIDQSLGGSGTVGKIADTVVDFVPFVGTANRLFTGDFNDEKGNLNTGQLGLSLVLDALGPVAKGAKVLYRGYKIAKGANKATKAVKNATKAAAAAEKSFERMAKSSIFKQEYKAWVKAAETAKKFPRDSNSARKYYEAEEALRKAMSKVPEAKKYLSKLDDTRNALADAANAAAGTRNISKLEGIDLASRESNHPILSTIFGPNKKIFLGIGATRAISNNRNNFPGTVTTSVESKDPVESTPADPTNTTGSLGEDTSLIESTPVETVAQVAEAMRQGILNRSSEVGAANY